MPGTDARTRRNWNTNATAYEARSLGDGIELEKDNTTNPSLNNRLRIAIDVDKGLQFISGEIGIDIPTDGALKLNEADGLQVDIAGMAANATPAEADSFLFEDSGGSDAKEHATLAELRAAVITPPADGGLKNTTKVFEVDIAGMAAQATPAEADSFLLEDSGGTDAKEHVTLAEMRTALINPPADGGLKNTTSAFEVDIAGMAALAAPDDADVFLVENVGGDAKEKTTWLQIKNLVSGLWTFPADGAIKKVGTAEYQVDISGMAANSTPAEGDLFLVEEVAVADGKEKTTLAELRTALVSFPSTGGLKNTANQYEVDIAGMTEIIIAENDNFLVEDLTDATKKRMTLANLRNKCINPPSDGAIKNTNEAFEVDISGMSDTEFAAINDTSAVLLFEHPLTSDSKLKIDFAALRLGMQNPATQVTKTGAYTVVEHDKVVLCNSASAFTVTLFSVAVKNLIYIKNIGTGLITITPKAGDVSFEEGVGSVLTLDQFDSVTLISDGTNWWIL